MDDLCNMNPRLQADLQSSRVKPFVSLGDGLVHQPLEPRGKDFHRCRQLLALTRLADKLRHTGTRARVQTHTRAHFPTPWLTLL